MQQAPCSSREPRHATDSSSRYLKRVLELPTPSRSALRRSEQALQTPVKPATKKRRLTRLESSASDMDDARPMISSSDVKDAMSKPQSVSSEANQQMETGSTPVRNDTREQRTTCDTPVKNDVHQQLLVARLARQVAFQRVVSTKQETDNAEVQLVEAQRMLAESSVCGKAKASKEVCKARREVCASQDKLMMSKKNLGAMMRHVESLENPEPHAETEVCSSRSCWSLGRAPSRKEISEYEHKVVTEDMKKYGSKAYREATADFISLGESAMAKAFANSKVAAAAGAAASVADFIRKRRPKILVLLGAGASTSAGIPDFRSPGIGLYDNLAEYDLPRPESVFNLEFFRENPQPFYHLAQRLWPKPEHKPTHVHNFLRILHEEGLLLRCYTQNIDGLEHAAGLPDDKVVEVHGNFRRAYGIDTEQEVSAEELKSLVFSEGDAAEKIRSRYGELVKPGIVFFGEPLPSCVNDHLAADQSQCQLLLVIGSSLRVAPIKYMVGRVAQTCPRVLINNEPVGLAPPDCDQTKALNKGELIGGFHFGAVYKHRKDTFLQGACDEGITNLCTQLGWEERVKCLGG